MRHIRFPRGWKVTDQPLVKEASGCCNGATKTLHFINPSFVNYKSNDSIIIHEITHARLADKGIKNNETHETRAFHTELSYSYKNHGPENLKETMDFIENVLEMDVWKTHYTKAVNRVMKSNLWKRCLDKLETCHVG